MGFFRFTELPGPDLRCAIEEMATSEVFAHLEPSEDSDLGVLGSANSPRFFFWNKFYPPKWVLGTFPPT